MSYHVHLTHAKDCLTAGQMTETRVWLRRAEATATTDAEDQEVRIWAFRYCLLTGQYELGQQLLLDVERHEVVLPDTPEPLREALYSAAGWGPYPAESTTDLFSLLTYLIHDQPLVPEQALIMLGAWSRLVPHHPHWLNELATKSFPQEVWEGLGERVLPANVEATLAELWYGAGGHGKYPRRVFLEQNEAEDGFAFLPAFCDLLLSLQQGDVDGALAASDRLFPNEGAWLWLRALDLVRHFGDPVTLARTPLRLRIARRTLHTSFSGSAGLIAADAYGPLVHSFTRTMSRCQLLCVPTLTPDEDGPSLADVGKALEKMFPTSTPPAAPWFAASGACLTVSRFLDSCRAQALPFAPAFADLLPLHKFVLGAALADRTAADLWRALPPVWQEEAEYRTLLLKALPAAPEEVALACVPILQGQGVPMKLILPALPSGAQAAVFLGDPEPTNLIVAASLPEEVLQAKWIAMTEAAWALGSQKLKASERAAQEALVRRLTACLDRPADSPPAEKAFTDLTDRMMARPAASEAEALMLCRLGLRLADVENWNEADRLLERAGEAGATFRGEVAAQQWLKTGQAEAYKLELWRTAGPWAEMALAWADLLDLHPARLPEVNPLRAKFSDLAAAWDALASWRDFCLASDTPEPFVATLLLDDIADRWQFLRSLRSWRLLTSSADVLPPITGLTMGPDRPFLALVSLSRFGTDAAALRVVLPPLLTSEPLPLLALGLLEQSLKAAETSELLRGELRRLLTPGVTDSFGAAFSPVQPTRLKALMCALPLALASPEVRTLLRLNQAKADEKQIRLALQKVQVPDLTLDGVWAQMGEFLTGPHFCPWSLPQWELIREWREHVASQGADFKPHVLGKAAKSHQRLLSRLLFEPLHPALLDASNILRDDDVSSRFESPLDCLLQLWTALADRGNYPVLTCADSTEYRYQEDKHGPEAKRRLNELIREGLIDCRAGYVGDERTADYRLLRRVQREFWQESTLLVTNDHYSKPPERGGWGHVFPWLTDATLRRMQATFRPEDGQWLLRLPDGTEVAF